MSRERLALSFLIAFHIVALAVNAIPSPTPADDGAEARPPNDPIAALLTPAVDRLASWFAIAESYAFDASRPIRLLTRPYVDAGLRQQWDMFGRPQTTNQYVRLVYYVASSEQPGVHTIRELIFPADPEGSVRVRHAFRDKAVLNAIEGSSVGPNDLASLTRYFRRRYARSHLPPDALIVRTELWYGTAPMAHRGERLAEQVARARRRVLAGYDMSAPTMAAASVPQISDSEHEADIVWTLQYVENQ